MSAGRGLGEARIRHTAVGLNFVDIYNRSGLYPAQLPSGLGGEAAGVVEEVGAGVSDLKPGDRVAYGAAPLGAYAEARLSPPTVCSSCRTASTNKTAAANDAEGADGAISDPPDLSRQIGRHHPAACRGGRVGLILFAMGEASRRHVIGTVAATRRRSLRRSMAAPTHRLHARGLS